MIINIEICKYKDMWKLRIGDIEGCTESPLFNKEQVLKEISEAMDKLTALTGRKDGD